MLVLSRPLYGKIEIIPPNGKESITITVLPLKNQNYQPLGTGPYVKIGIEAPQDYLILRQELVEREGGIEKILEEHSMNNSYYENGGGI